MYAPLLSRPFLYYKYIVSFRIIRASKMSFSFCLFYCNTCFPVSLPLFYTPVAAVLWGGGWSNVRLRLDIKVHYFHLCFYVLTFLATLTYFCHVMSELFCYLFCCSSMKLHLRKFVFWSNLKQLLLWSLVTCCLEFVYFPYIHDWGLYCTAHVNVYVCLCPCTVYVNVIIPTTVRREQHTLWYSHFTHQDY